MGKWIIQTTPNGEQGIPGVDLASLSLRVYGALCKLKDMEVLLEAINSSTAQAWEQDDVIEQLIHMGKQRADGGLKKMKVSTEFEGVFRDIKLTEREIGFLVWVAGWDNYTIEDLKLVVQKV